MSLRCFQLAAGSSEGLTSPPGLNLQRSVRVSMVGGGGHLTGRGNRPGGSLEKERLPVRPKAEDWAVSA